MEVAGSIQEGRRWFALGVLCTGVLMIVLDSTVVNVALPSIRSDLGFTETSLVWVVNAYLVTYGGFLALGGRLGDLFGHRRLFLNGITVFTLASIACGLARGSEQMVVARLVQGAGGAVVSSVALSLLLHMFAQPEERAKAMGVYGFVCAAGGSVGVLAGGTLTSALNWHWIFLVNVPIGLVVYVLCARLLPEHRIEPHLQRLDVGGAITLTISSIMAVYAIVSANETGWNSVQAAGALVGAMIIFLAFIAIEVHASAPLVPLSWFRSSNAVVANIIAVLWASTLYAWSFISSLYLQRVLQLDAMHVGLVFLPANLIMAAASLTLSAELVTRFGIRLPLTLGLLLPAAGLALLARAPVDGKIMVDVLPGMMLIGLGAGFGFNPLLLFALSDAPLGQSGLASGLINTSFTLGGAIGLALLVSRAGLRTESLVTAGTGTIEALNSGYHVALGIGALCAITAAVLAVVRLPRTLESIL